MPSRDAIERSTAGVDGSAFVEDPKTYDAVERCLERISEAASELGPQAEGLCPGLPWARIRGIGNRLRHEYDRINGPRIWLVVERDLPPLKGAVRTALTHLLAKEGEG